MKLYVIRHGETDTNLKGLLNGRLDEDLNITGIKQANLASDILKYKDINLIITSSLKRTMQTAKIINKNNVPVIIDDRFIEREMGELTLTKSSLVDYDEYCSLDDSKYKGLENVSDLMKRVYEGLEYIKNNYNDNKNILIVTHGAITRCIYSYFNGVPKDLIYLNAKSQKNCEIREYDM